MRCIAVHRFALHRIAWNFTALHCTAQQLLVCGLLLHCIALYFIALYCVALHRLDADKTGMIVVAKTSPALSPCPTPSHPYTPPHLFTSPLLHHTTSCRNRATTAPPSPAFQTMRILRPSESAEKIPRAGRGRPGARCVLPIASIKLSCDQTIRISNPRFPSLVAINQPIKLYGMQRTDHSDPRAKSHTARAQQSAQ